MGWHHELTSTVGLWGLSCTDPATVRTLFSDIKTVHITVGVWALGGEIWTQWKNCICCICCIAANVIKWLGTTEARVGLWSSGSFDLWIKTIQRRSERNGKKILGMAWHWCLRLCRRRSDLRKHGARWIRGSSLLTYVIPHCWMIRENFKHNGDIQPGETDWMSRRVDWFVSRMNFPSGRNCLMDSEETGHVATLGRRSRKTMT